MKLEQFYQQFNENLRLLSNVGRVEFETTIRLINRYLQ